MREFCARSLPIVLCCFALWNQPAISIAQEGEGEGVGAAATETPAPLDTGDTAWMLVSTALVLMMTAPGLALFYGGLVRRKNILSVIMQCVFLMGLMSVVWAIAGFSLAFGGAGGFIGNFDHLFLNGVTPYWDSEAGAAVVPMEGSIPKSVFMMFQGMFFIITPALICGSIAERVRFAPLCVFLLLWGLLVYCPIAHWVWGADGWLLTGQFAALDFAGGTVVHISSGVSALVLCVLLGARAGFRSEPMPPHNLTYTAIGTALLWVGWFGFNAGSALSAGESAANAFVATHLAAAAGVLGWSVAEWIVLGRPTVLGACSGAVAGLVGITPAAGAVDPMRGIAIGLITAICCYLACTKIKNLFHYDDSLDAFGVHGVGGAVGAILTGVFATAAVTGDPEVVGLLEGGTRQFINQWVGVGAAAGYAAVGTVVLYFLVNAILGLRVRHEEELRGLDLSQHGEEGYIFQ
ncbi:ammonium transporter [Calycomorphotria hydatis]|uniref:Ammonium transporter n=1 Tax=Calycomorphotria hydatis TaxID=2528027 RepID=A0A517T6Z2_9PLAN|nr:ammonium transporter [Calycomorphotria hydatis]QDT64139.1 Ammonia channel precursor [Calycomorphotria hydatis]